MSAIDRFDLAGRVAVVTGGTRGLGEGFATALTDAGATVCWSVVTATAARSSSKP